MALKRGAKRSITKDVSFIKEVARLRYKEGMRVEEIAKLMGVSAPTIWRALEEARRRKIVMVKIVEEAERANRIPDLEEGLKEKLRLRDAIVVDATPLFPEGDNLYDPRDDDRLHSMLGQALADFLKHFLRPGDCILLGGGRTVFYAALYLADMAREEKLYLSGAKAIPLSGVLRTMVHSPQESLAPPSVDSIDAAIYFSRAIGMNEFKLLSRPTAYLGPEDAEEDRRRILKELEGYTSFLCISGVGRLGGKTRFMDYEDPLLKPFKEDIKGIIDLLYSRGAYEKIEWSVSKPMDERMAVFYPIGDLMDKMFPVFLNDVLMGSSFAGPAEEVSDAEEFVEKLWMRLASFNKKVVGLPLSKLAELNPLVILGGAGYPKYGSIVTALCLRRPDGRRFVDILCTDSYTAERLLKEERLNDVEIYLDAIPGEEGEGPEQKEHVESFKEMVKVMIGFAGWETMRGG